MSFISTRTAILVIVSGFFISCSQAYEPVTRNTPEIPPQELLGKAFELQEQDSTNPVGFHYQGIALQRLALIEVPGSRADVYASMIQAFDQASLLYGNDRQGIAERGAIQELIATAWRHEYNSGAGILASTSQPAPEQLNLALVHASNAIVIAPDSISAYLLMSNVYMKKGDADNAIASLEPVTYREFRDAGIAYEHLGYMHSIQGNTQDAVHWYEQSLSWHKSLPGSNPSESPILEKGSILNVKHGLINAYYLNQQFDEALVMANELAEVYPNRPLYDELRISIHLNIVRKTVLEENSDSNTQATTGNSLRAIKTLLEKHPSLELPTALSLLDISSTYYEVMVSENENFLFADDLTGLPILELSISLLEALFEADPQASGVAYNLADAYLLLGLEDEAENLLAPLGQ